MSAAKPGNAKRSDGPGGETRHVARSENGLSQTKGTTLKETARRFLWVWSGLRCGGGYVANDPGFTRYRSPSLAVGRLGQAYSGDVYPVEVVMVLLSLAQ